MGGELVICAAHKEAIVKMLERMIEVAVEAKKVFSKFADWVCRAINAKLEPLKSSVKTLTMNNRHEFADYMCRDQGLGIQTYFADPYCSW